MSQTIEPAVSVRVANFSNIDLPGEHRLDFSSDDVGAMVNKIRKYADLPYVYVVGKDHARQAIELMSALKAVRSPCYPYAVFLIDGADLDIRDIHLDIVRIESTDAKTIQDRITAYALYRLDFDFNKLRIRNPRPLPARVDVAVVGAGITGLYAANRLAKAGISSCLLEKSDRAGGIWSQYANRSSRVNSSESAYRLFEKETRSNRDHSDTREILEDIAELAKNVSKHLFIGTEVEKIETSANGYNLRLNRGGKQFSWRVKASSWQSTIESGRREPQSGKTNGYFKGKSSPEFAMTRRTLIGAIKRSWLSVWAPLPSKMQGPRWKAVHGM